MRTCDDVVVTYSTLNSYSDWRSGPNPDLFWRGNIASDQARLSLDCVSSNACKQSFVDSSQTAVISDNSPMPTITPLPRSVRAQMLERRRLRAWELHNSGWRSVDIAAALDVSAAAVSQWIKSAKLKGAEGLQARPKTGAPRSLTDRHLLMLRALMSSSPRDHRIDSDVWTRQLLAEMIERLFGPRFSLQHVGRLMRRIESETHPVPKVVHLELRDLLKGADISRIRSQIRLRHGRH
ncbi:MAG: helix-turn-helix domain-containing protein [Candidatus Kapabacteria bacterium]|nr:helix-turn-helix domain-containing protein [Candidatus Kapabacteria bacterium]